jgi:ADP-heptose:LPS heptosyltransferase
MGANVIFKAPNNLIDLFRQSNLKAEIIEENFPDEKIIYDTYISLLSIPRILKTNLDNIPFSSGYLKINKEKVEDYRQKHLNNKNFKIGIKWKGTLKGNQNRQIPLKYFYDLAKLPNTEVYSFQKGAGIEQLQEVPPDIQITDLGSTFNNFADTAAAMENMDLIICNDTSIVHLAGALGKTVWILLPQTPEWRWLLNREDSPWYDSVRLFRQKKAGDWQEVMQRVIDACQLLILQSK